ncbi:hypothetical protein [Natribacillus halophilus]|uniref:Uncharacterized protein n=1 Tax=Natribacillus halophilus TaxID=549003 RepID=A0A1G8KF78_9BACI|nr:hypothetical protein [Natribacillus halophilus]SDI42059.1 hypothetical protein SAMN04488123_10266 [Natribacillus halophilus]
MITVWYRTGLYVSSFFPLYILLYLDNIEFLTDLKTLKSLITFNIPLPSVFFLTLAMLILISIASVVVLKTISHNERYSFKGIKKTEDNLLSYVVTYLVPILSIEITDPSSLLVNLGLFSLLGFIYVKNSLVYLNPLFLFFKYNIFISEDDEILISNYNINELKLLEKTKVNVRKLSFNIYLIRREANKEI